MVVEILLWLVFPAVTTTMAMTWAAWAGRRRRSMDEDDSAVAHARFAAAVQMPHPARGKGVPPAAVDPASGVAVRRQLRPGRRPFAASPRESGRGAR